MKWFEVDYDADTITISRRKALFLKSVTKISWFRIIRVCFLVGDHIKFDEVYLFTDERPESWTHLGDSNYGAKSSSGVYSMPSLQSRLHQLLVTNYFAGLLKKSEVKETDIWDSNTEHIAYSSFKAL